MTLIFRVFKWIKSTKTNFKEHPAKFIYKIKPSGERGIRTPGTVLQYTRFPGVPVKPLLHLSRFPACQKNRAQNNKNL
jgi:hypothetical protein